MLELAKLSRAARLMLAAAALLGAGQALAEGEESLPPANVRVDNLAALQRGARLYFNYCSGCHSIKYMSYSRLAEDLKLGEAEVLANFAFTGAKIGDQIETNMPEANSAQWFGKTPPDLSLEARAKGPDWIYGYLKSFYLDPSRPSGWNNTVFPNVSMPNVLWELQGVQHATFAAAKPGDEPKVEKLVPGKGRLTPAEYDESVRDLTTFLAYVGEPAALKRESVGVWVVLYLAFFTFLAWLLKHEYWKDVH
ncbi:MAG TPA: cytochrome c1 [Casimicrobiaceae bacterium]|nr:cytochrome c1 [Casimicrobiaceae bacterium]